MPINYATVKTSLHTWASSVVPVGMPVIFWELNSPRPEIPYVTLFLSTVSAVNQDWSDDSTDINGSILMKGDRRFTVSINAYGGTDTLTVLENIRSSLQKKSVLDGLRVNGIVFYESETINDITDLIDSMYERRAQMDVFFAIGQNYTDTTGYFDKTQITETFFDPSDAIVYTEIINIP